MVKSKGKNFRAMLVPYGEYTTFQDDGKGNSVKKIVKVPEARAARWAKEFEGLKKKGVKFPVPWGHSEEAIPDEKIYESRLTRDNEGEFAFRNATYIEKLEAGKDGLWFEAEVPPGFEVENGALVNKSTGTKAADFSAGIGDWMDNTGTEHPDIILHAAIVPLAVCSNNHQVVALSSNRSGKAKFTATLSANQRSRPMADKKKEDKEPKDEMPPFEEKEVAEVNDDEEFEGEEVAEGAESPENAATPVAATEPSVEMQSEGGDNHFANTAKTLRDMGLDVPQDLAESEGWKWLDTALRVAASMGAKFVKPNEGGSEGESFEKSTMEEPEVTAENPPILMSSNITDPLTKKLAQREQDRIREELKETWTKAQKAGCPSHIAARESNKSGKVFLSMNSKTGNFLVPAALAKAKLVAEVLTAIKESGAAVLTEQLSTAHVNQPTRVTAQDLVGEKVDEENVDRIDKALKRGASR